VAAAAASVLTQYELLRLHISITPLSLSPSLFSISILMSSRLSDSVARMPPANQCREAHLRGPSTPPRSYLDGQHSVRCRERRPFRVPFAVQFSTSPANRETSIFVACRPVTLLSVVRRPSTPATFPSRSAATRSHTVPTRRDRAFAGRNSIKQRLFGDRSLAQRPAGPSLARKRAAQPR